MASQGLAAFPHELIVNILINLEQAIDVLNAGRTCKAFYSCSHENAVWASVANSFKYWTPNQEPRMSTETTWLSKVKCRFQQNDVVDAAILELIQNSEYDFLPKFQRVMDIGIEAKDRTLYHMNKTPNDGPDTVSRRYWARRLYGACQRQQAIEILELIHKGDTPIPLDKVYAAVDMLIIEKETADVLWVTPQLDLLADEFKKTYTEWMSFSTFNILQLLGTFLVYEKNFKGLQNLPKEGHFLLQHHFISKTLLHPKHAGTDLVYAVIFSSILARLGQTAEPMAYGNRIVVAVHSTGSLNEGDDNYKEKLYYDLFNQTQGPQTKDEVLTSFRTSSSEDSRITLKAISPLKLLNMIGRQLTALYQIYIPLYTELDLSEQTLDVQPFLYRLHGLLAITVDPENNTAEALHWFRVCSMRLEEPWIMILVTKFIKRIASGFTQQSENLLSLFKGLDSGKYSWRAPKLPPAGKQINQPEFRLGDVVQYTHWDNVNGEVSEIGVVVQRDWNDPNGSNVKNGNSYHIDNDLTGRKVLVEENRIERVYPEDPIYLDNSARYFLRWDDVEKRFVSNRKNGDPDYLASSELESVMDTNTRQ